MRVRILPAVLIAAWAAAPAHAQWVATPYLGTNFGGTGTETGKLLGGNGGGLGGSIGYFRGRLGFELDIERHWHFFHDPDLEIPNNCGIAPRDVPCVDVNTRATSFMGNVVVLIRTKSEAKWRPYGTAGLGLIHATARDDLGEFDKQQDNFAFNVGGGLMYRLNPRLGLRSEVRYFHALVDEEKRTGVLFKDYGFWRVTLGVTFGFPR
jgi:opacity protein-like surface antigen